MMRVTRTLILGSTIHLNEVDNKPEKLMISGFENNTELEEKHLIGFEMKLEDSMIERIEQGLVRLTYDKMIYWYYDFTFNHPAGDRYFIFGVGDEGGGLKKEMAPTLTILVKRVLN